MMRIEDLTAIELGLILLFILLLSILFSQAFDWSRILKLPDCLSFQYGYRNHNGPTTWKDNFPNAKGRMQSPINISTKFALVVPHETQNPIKFSPQYYIVPNCLQICNDGHTVVLYAFWNDNKAATICGGPLKASHKFFNARFRWGPTDDNGSEHTIDFKRYSLEVQATHLRCDHSFHDMNKAVEDNAVVIVSYFYQITPYDNPCLEVIANSLSFIENPYSTHCIEPVPISWIVPPFTTSYFSYYGSLTSPPCTEGVQWLVQTEPLAISTKQLNMFRRLLSFDGHIETNTRPVQEVQCREIYLYD